jgi:hypothetical protein
MGVLRTTLVGSDHVAGQLAARLATFGQLALAGLGTHLAADRLDDHILAWLLPVRDTVAEYTVPWLIGAAKGFGWAEGTFIGWADWSLVPASASIALGVELLALLIFAEAILLTPLHRVPSPRDWWKARSIHALMLPAALGSALLAGGWSLAMAAEDLLPPSEVAPYAAGLLAFAVLVRFGWPAWARAVADLKESGPRRRGLKRSVVLAPLLTLIWLEALPVWGLPGLLDGAG